MTIRRNATALPLVLLLAACVGRGAVERSQEYAHEGYPLQAFAELERERTRILHEGGEPDEALEKAYQEATRRWLVERGRQEIYADQELRGITTLRHVLDRDPADAEALALVDRAQRKLARRQVDAGLDHLAKNDFEEAVKCFRQAQAYKPGFPPALEGERAVGERVARLHGEAQKQFLEAIRKLPEMRYPEVDWHAQAAITRDPSRDDAADVKQRALRELALVARERGDAAREAKNYGAALMEYRTARGLWAGLPDIDSTIATMEREVQATWKTESAQLAIEASRFDRATKLLDEAYELSTLERSSISELRLLVRKSLGRRAYEAARDLELQGLKQEALAAFEALVADWPDGLDDEQMRVVALKADIAGAERSYAEADAAEQKGDLAAALDAFTTARLYYARYRDVAERIASLKARLEPAPATEPGGQAPVDPAQSGQTPAGQEPPTGTSGGQTPAPATPTGGS